MRIFILVQGLIESSDSIGYDSVFQYRLFKQLGYKVNLFSGTYKSENHPDVIIEDIKDLDLSVNRLNPSLIVYHWCDGWDIVDEYLLNIKIPIIIRWHNNTPPWFLAPYSLRCLRLTMRGYNNIFAISKLNSVVFWVNSNFTKEQLVFLGINANRIAVVYPASYYVERKINNRSLEFKNANCINLLFVGRVVSHKGHNHVLLVASYLKKLTNKTVNVKFPGRMNDAFKGYISGLIKLAESLGINLELPGEVSQADLDNFYKEADVFLCLSEHEGFGLPVIEAMQMGLPVVGYRTTAIAELLREHPLACDSLDYAEIAKKIISLQDDSFKQSIIEFQFTRILPGFSKEIIVKQIHDGLKVANNVRSYPKEFNDVSKEFPVNFVTLYDINAYNFLLKQAGNIDNIHNMDDCMYCKSLAYSAESVSSVYGKIASFLRKIIVKLSYGFIRAHYESQASIRSQLKVINEKLDAMKDRF